MKPSNTRPSSYTVLVNPPEENTNGDTISTLSTSERGPPSILPKFHFDISRRKTLLYLRLFAFFIIEAGFITLAAVCLVKPIPLGVHFSFTDDEIKGGFTTIFVIWQHIAIFMGSYMVADAFSREWSVQLARVGLRTNGPPGIAPEMIDRVSTITSGFLDRSFHLLVNRSSGTFKLAFLTSLTFLALSSLGPGTMNVATTITIQIGRLLSHAHDSDAQAIFTAQARANLIVRLEKVEHSIFGFKLQPNMLGPIPQVNLTSFNGSIEYDSDVIEFHHDCHWEAPQFFNVSGSIVVASGGQRWNGATIGTGGTVGPAQIGSSIGSLSLLDFAAMEQFGKSAFIFSGGNSSILDRRSTPPVPYAVDLTSLPTTLTAQGAGLDLKSNSLFAPLASVLHCDPRPQITGGRVSISDETQSILFSGQPIIGNIPQSAANLIFTNALGKAVVEVEDLTVANLVNLPAAMIFMAGSSSVDWNNAHGVHPLDLPSINENMDTFMLSAAKAFIDGYRQNGTNAGIHYDQDIVIAKTSAQQLLLSTSEPLFIATTILVAITTLLLLALCKSGVAQDRYPFDLKHVSEMLSLGGQREESMSAAWVKESEEV